MSVTISCDWCDEVYETYPSRISEDKNNFCSRECSTEYKRRDQITVPCAWCGDTVRVPPSRQSDFGEYGIDNHFCNKNCESEFKSNVWVGEDHPKYDGGKETVLCEECGTEYSVKPAKVSYTRFCSAECRDMNNRVEAVDTTCSVCGDLVSRKPYDIGDGAVTCSDACFRKFLSDIRSGESNPAWNGGKETYYGSNWNEERRIALSESGYKCSICGVSRDEHYDMYGRDLNVHHRIRLGNFEEPEMANFQDNLVVCCIECHHAKLEQDPTPHNEIIAPKHAQT